jgi:hypothetical protein
MLWQGRETVVTSMIWNSHDNERLSIWNGSFAIVSMSIVNGFVAMYLLDALHASNNEIAMLNSLPSMVNLVAMLAAAMAIGQVQSKKRFCVTATSVSRTFYVWIAIVPLFAVHHPALWVVWLVALTRVPQSFGDLSWQALISDLIPTQRRSVFFSERNRTTTIVGLVTTLFTGILLQQFDKHLKWPYELVFISTVLFALAEIWLLMRHDDGAPSVRTEPLLVKGIRRFNSGALKSALRDKQYISVVAALLLFNLGWQMAWPLFNIFQIKTAHATALWLGLFTVANQTTQILTFRWWGRMADRHGTGKMMAFAAFGMGLAPVITMLSTNMYYLTVVNLFTGIPVAGTVLLLFNYLLEVCPESVRTTYIAYYNVALSVVGFIAPELGIYLLQYLGMPVGMDISSVIRLVAGVTFLIVWRWHMKVEKPVTGQVTV